VVFWGGQGGFLKPENHPKKRSKNNAEQMKMVKVVFFRT
jgi:hypothetical protein